MAIGLTDKARRWARKATAAAGKERYWWQRPCNTAQEGGEGRALGSNVCRVSMSAMVTRLKATWLRLGALRAALVKGKRDVRVDR